MIKPWQELQSAEKGNFRIFSVRSKVCVSPRTGANHEFYVLNSPNWVNVVALTDDGRMLFVEQYRQGTNTVELELPGGIIDKEDASPVAAGVRELREETGFEGQNARIIGEVFANPAFMNNTVYTVMVENCRMTSKTDFDSGEDLSTRLIPVGDVPSLITGGTIKHSLIVAALYYYELARRAASR